MPWVETSKEKIGKDLRRIRYLGMSYESLLSAWGGD